jgi:hypothetical protein
MALIAQQEQARAAAREAERFLIELSTRCRKTVGLLEALTDQDVRRARNVGALVEDSKASACHRTEISLVLFGSTALFNGHLAHMTIRVRVCGVV